MCGIAGWIDFNNNLIDKKQIIKNMIDTLIKRGPDESGIYISNKSLLGHRRLIVIDPEGGKQPMIKRYGDKKYVLVYNGELYNTDDLRKQLILKGHKFGSYSDTEVLLEAYIEWKEECVNYLNGIYAFAVWEEQSNTLYLARDRLGVKPLFYSINNNSIIFGSEIKALLAHPYIEPIVDEEGLLELFGLGPARTLGSGIYKNIQELKAGEYIKFNKDGIIKKIYWKIKSLPHKENLDTTIEHVRNLMIDAVERQLVSDVPICTFLSGGLDSSIISSISSMYMKKNGREKLKTYSIDYVDNKTFFKANDFQHDLDSMWVGKMAEYIDSEHKNIVLGTEELLNALDDAVLANDLPGMADIDSSLYLFCKEVKKDATVALSGECADEIFGGYPWFTKERDLFCNTFPWSRYVNERKKILSKEFQKMPLDEYVNEKYKQTLNEIDLIDNESEKNKRVRIMTYLNLKWFMITLLNRKDRMSMSNSLEVRVPFADHRIVEYTWNIPWEYKFLNSREKGLLRATLKGLLPDEILKRKKNPYPKTHNPLYLKLVQQRMKTIIQNKNAPILKLINYEELKKIVDTGGKAFKNPWYGQLMTDPQLLAYFIQINTWMEKYKIILKK